MNIFEYIKGLQDRRGIWLLMAGSALFLLLSAMGFFQIFLAMKPCELCVYIRFSQCTILLAALIILINPKIKIFKFLGIALAWWAILQGLIWSWELKNIWIAAHTPFTEGSDPFASMGAAAGAACKTIPSFPLGLPLNEWLHFEFSPQGGCGEDDWTLFSMTMADWLLLIYGLYTVALLCVSIASFASIKFMKDKIIYSVIASLIFAAIGFVTFYNVSKINLYPDITIDVRSVTDFKNSPAILAKNIPIDDIGSIGSKFGIAKNAHLVVSYGKEDTNPKVAEAINKLKKLGYTHVRASGSDWTPDNPEQQSATFTWIIKTIQSLNPNLGKE